MHAFIIKILFCGIKKETTTFFEQAVSVNSVLRFCRRLNLFKKEVARTNIIANRSIQTATQDLYISELFQEPHIVNGFP